MLILVAIVTAAAIGVWAQATNFFQSYISDPLDADLVLNVDEVPEAVYERHINLSGRTSLPSHIKVKLNDYSYTEANTDGNFNFDISLHSGVNRIQVIANSVVGWREMEQQTYLRTIYAPPKPSVPVLFPQPAIVNSATIHVRGEADPSGELTVRIEKLSVPSEPAQPKLPTDQSNEPSQTLMLFPDESGSFGADIKFSEEGSYRITAQASNQKNEQSYVSNALDVRYDKSYYHEDPPVKTSAFIAIGYREVKTDLEATLPNEDPLVSSLVTGKLTTPEFVLAVFGYWTINDQGILDDVTFDSTPLYVVGNKFTTVKLSSIGTSSNISLPAFAGTLKINRLFLHSANDNRITLNVKDYRLHSLSPPPSSFSGNEAIWLGEHIPEMSRDGITAQLSSDLSADPLRLLQLTPRALFPNTVAKILELLRDSLPAISLIWFLWLLRKSKYNPSTGESLPFETTTHRLLILTLIPVAWRAASLNWGISVASNYVVSLHNSDFRFYIDNLITAVLAITVVFIIAFWFRRWFPGFALTTLTKNLLKAALLVALLFAFLLGVNQFGIAGYQSLTMLVVTPVFVVFLWGVARWIKRMLKSDPSIADVRLNTRQRIVLLAVAAVLTYPTDIILFHVYSIRTSEKVLLAWQQCFSEISHLAPYALVPAIFILLRRLEANPGGAENGESNNAIHWSLSALLFSSYLVGVDPSWFWLPIPFLLSLYVFPRLVLLPIEEQTEVARLLSEVRAGRAASIRALKDRANPRQLRQALAKLEKKFNSGDLSLNDYETRSKQIEDYLQKEELPWSEQTSLKRNDLILAVSPYESNWQNGWWAAKKSLYLLVPLLVLYVLVFLLKDIQSFSSDLHLWFIVNLTTFMLDGIVGAIFFGYFFNSIRVHPD